MSDALVVLDQIRARGGRVDRVGDRLRIMPARVLTAALRDELRRHKAELLTIVPDASPPGASAAPRYPLRVVVEGISGFAASVVAQSIEADLRALEAAVERYSRVWSDDARIVDAAALGRRIEELLDRLNACGMRVRVGAVH